MRPQTVPVLPDGVCATRPLVAAATAAGVVVVIGAAASTGPALPCTTGNSVAPTAVTLPEVVRISCIMAGWRRERRSATQLYAAAAQATGVFA